MKKIISIVVIMIAFLLINKNAKADIIITQNTPIQYNMYFDDGFYYGLSATTGITTIPYPSFAPITSVTVNPGSVWSISCDCFPPIDYVTVGDLTPMAASTNIYGLMTTTFKVSYFSFGGNIYISFMP